MKLTFVSPPFAGHLFPLLDLAQQLRARGFDELEILSTPEARPAVEQIGLPFIPLLTGRSHVVTEISDTARKIGSNPFYLWQQLRKNLSLMSQLRDELKLHWERARPDVVLADFTVPTAGLLAQSLGIRWWTSLPTVCVVETGDGVPSYLGGWAPWDTTIGRLRDRLGRGTIRMFKHIVHKLFYQQMAQAGLARLYRDNRFETIYSPDTILALGMRELEFPRSWPLSLQFIGPLVGSPRFAHKSPEFVAGKPHVLISLGTHLKWAKDPAFNLLRAVAHRMPDFVFHFTDGSVGGESLIIDGNIHRYGYLPYDQHLHRYSLSINHAGTGIMYSCLQHAVPILAWPQDYDQFDHAARLVHHGLAIKCRPQVEKIETDVRHLCADPTIHRNLAHFQERLTAYSPADFVAKRLRNTCA